MALYKCVYYYYYYYYLNLNLQITPGQPLESTEDGVMRLADFYGC